MLNKVKVIPSFSEIGPHFHNGFTELDIDVTVVGSYEECAENEGYVCHMTNTHCLLIAGKHCIVGVLIC